MSKQDEIMKRRNFWKWIAKNESWGQTKMIKKTGRNKRIKRSYQDIKQLKTVFIEQIPQIPW